jgi:hypothetical protein
MSLLYNFFITVRLKCSYTESYIIQGVDVEEIASFIFRENAILYLKKSSTEDFDCFRSSEVALLTILRLETIESEATHPVQADVKILPKNSLLGRISKFGVTDNLKCS